MKVLCEESERDSILEFRNYLTDFVKSQSCFDVHYTDNTQSINVAVLLNKTFVYRWGWRRVAQIGLQAAVGLLLAYY